MVQIPACYRDGNQFFLAKIVDFFEFACIKQSRVLIRKDKFDFHFLSSLKSWKERGLFVSGPNVGFQGFCMEVKFFILASS